MKPTYFRLLLSSLLFSLLGCERVIDLDLKEATPQYVIEGYLTNQRNAWTVYVSRTQNFKAVEGFNGVSGANVEIESQGKVFVLPEIAKGIYQHKPEAGVPGQTYQLRVKVDNRVFTASSKMPRAAKYAELKYNKEASTADRTIVTAVYQDIPETSDFYWFEQYVNNIKLSGYDVTNDEFTGGMNVSKDIIFKNSLNNGSYMIKSGDKIRVDMNCIDPSAYNYFFSLYNANGFALNGLAPSNPVSNISGGALGIFSAHTQQSKTIIVP